jgi:DNA-binding Lrp family transcriptional regulator
MIYLEFQQKLTDFAVRLLDLNLNKLKQKQINLIKIELLDLINEAKELEKFFVLTEDNNIMYKLTCENITSFIDVLNSTVKRIDDIQDDNLKVIITQVNELI